MMSTARTAEVRTGSGSRRLRAGSSTHNGWYGSSRAAPRPLGMSDAAGMS